MQSPGLEPGVKASRTLAAKPSIQNTTARFEGRWTTDEW
jgi:hypothetical protein